MIPFITCELSLGQHVSKLVFGVNIFDLDFGIHVTSVEQPVKSNSVGPGNMSHCIIVGVLPLMIILITASLSSKMYNIAPFEKKKRLMKQNRHWRIQNVLEKLMCWPENSMVSSMLYHATGHTMPACLSVFHLV